MSVNNEYLYFLIFAKVGNDRGDCRCKRHCVVIVGNENDHRHPWGAAGKVPVILGFTITYRRHCAVPSNRKAARSVFTDTDGVRLVRA